MYRFSSEIVIPAYISGVHDLICLTRSISNYLHEIIQPQKPAKIREHLENENLIDGKETEQSLEGNYPSTIVLAFSAYLRLYCYEHRQTPGSHLCLVHCAQEWRTLTLLADFARRGV